MFRMKSNVSYELSHTPYQLLGVWWLSCGAAPPWTNGLWGYNPEIMPVTCENVHCFSIYTIFEGTSEIQRLIIARAISGVHIR